MELVSVKDYLLSGIGWVLVICFVWVVYYGVDGNQLYTHYKIKIKDYISNIKRYHSARKMIMTAYKDGYDRDESFQEEEEQDFRH